MVQVIIMQTVRPGMPQDGGGPRGFASFLGTRWTRPIGTGVGLLLIIAALGACRSEQAEPREIRGHLNFFQGIAHGVPAMAAERYCRRCHGSDLQGGEAGEPSCYTCHGQNWLTVDAGVSLIPGDHSVINDGVHHHPDLFSPEQACVSCHGADLQGDTTLGSTRPGCELCHEQLWKSRAAP